jgi:pimeloyl-ACP methyl ester carboxylesterase
MRMWGSGVIIAKRRIAPALYGSLLILVVCCVGCTGLPHQMPDRAERLPHGYVYYMDGAGGGSAVQNWAGGVKDGMLAAGYAGAGEMFSWETGLGMMADQEASVRYKRTKAAEMARRLLDYSKSYPSAPVGIIGFSAGTAVGVFVLEALPKGAMVDNIVLLGASIGTDYDLTKSLRHVRGHMYLFTSPHDTVVGTMMAATGTADRKFGEAGAGVKGFTLAAEASEETRRLYAEKLVTIPWREEFERQDKYYGRHFDNVKMAFVRDHVAPLLMSETAPPEARNKP